MVDADESELTITVECDKYRQSAAIPLTELVSNYSVACRFCHELLDVTRPPCREAIRRAVEGVQNIEPNPC